MRDGIMKSNQLIDVRETMRVLPNWCQPTLTWITGKPYVGQKPIFRSNWVTQTVSALTSLFSGGVAGIWIAHQIMTGKPFFAPLLLPCWLLVAGAARKIQVTLVHQCSHFNYSGNRKLDRFLAQFMSTLIFVDHFDNYYHEHIRIHHTKSLSTSEDPDCKFLLQLGFKPGMTRLQLWTRLALTIVSPSFHFRFLSARFRSNYVDGPVLRQMASVLYLLLIGIFVYQTQLFLPFVLGWLVPLFPIYHVAALLNFSSLHFWLVPEKNGETKKGRMCSLTAGRFLGDRTPQISSSILSNAAAWTSWTVRLVFLHLPARVGVLSGDLPVHDYHHRYPHCNDWANFIYTRQYDIERGTPGWNIAYEENWGLFNAIDAVYLSLSKIETKRANEPNLLNQNETRQYLVQI